MKCIIPCGGFGTRMQKLGLNKPKAFAEVGRKKIIEYILDKVSLVEEVDEVFIVSNSYFFKDFSEWFENFDYSKPLHLLCDGVRSNDERKGALFNTLQGVTWMNRAGVEDDLLIIYGDNLFNFDLNDVVKTFKESGNDVVAVCDVCDFEKAKCFGVISVDEKGVITSIVEKPDNPQSTLIATGVYVFRKESKKWLYEDYSNLKDVGIGHVLIRMFKETPVQAFTVPDGCKWFDVGSPETYLKVKENF
ncbi:MAG: nucleotidyltransferase family protein [Nanoarchaeota archaeon]|nr:nucleotidyltransferase family protein [Nanoarchaeota archaeon]